MCDTARAPRAAGTVPRPRWTTLYVATPLVLVTGAAVEAFVSPGGRRMVAEAVAALGALAVLGLWVRLNRVALDLEDWCDCARDRMVVRVVASRRLPPAAVTSEQPERRADAPVARSLATRPRRSAGSSMSR